MNKGQLQHEASLPGLRTNAKRASTQKYLRLR